MLNLAHFFRHNLCLIISALLKLNVLFSSSYFSVLTLLILSFGFHSQILKSQVSYFSC